MSTTLLVKKDLRFKDGNVCFCVKGRLIDKPGKIWLVQESVPSAGWRRTTMKPPVEMSEQRILELAERQIGDNLAVSMNTIGPRVGSTMKAPPKLLALYERRRAAQAGLTA
ncbi:MAG: hypothetical protein AAB365_01910 [Patescibacteria group bacterium]